MVFQILETRFINRSQVCVSFIADFLDAGLKAFGRLPFGLILANMIYMENRDIDWTGVKPLEVAIEPLTSQTFVERLNRLSAQANALRVLRKAFLERDGNEAE